MAGGLPGLPTDALAGYHFAIEIDGVTIAQFQEVSGIASEIDVIQLKENNKDGKFVIQKLPGNLKPPTITFKRGKTPPPTSGTGIRRSIEGKSRSPARTARSFSTATTSEVSRYNFVNAWPSKVSTGASKRAVTRSCGRGHDRLRGAASASNEPARARPGARGAMRCGRSSRSACPGVTWTRAARSTAKARCGWPRLGTKSRPSATLAFRENEAYLTVILLSRVVTKLGSVTRSPRRPSKASSPPTWPSCKTSTGA